MNKYCQIILAIITIALLFNNAQANYSPTSGLNSFVANANNLKGKYVNSDYCHAYANLAAAQTRRNISKRCNIVENTTDLAIQWSTNTKPQYNWCMTVSSYATEKEALHRERRLLSCLVNGSYQPIVSTVRQQPQPSTTSSHQFNCSSNNINKEKAACYAVIFGPEVCLAAIKENNPSLASKAIKSALCTAGVSSVFARQSIAENLLWDVADTAFEEGCSMITDDTKDFLTRLLVGGGSCIASAASWMLKLSKAEECVQRVKKQCM